MADFGALSKLTKRADAVSESASVLVSRAIRDIRGEISNLSDELNLAGSADARDKAYTMIRNRMNRLGTQLNRLLVAQQQMSAKAAAKSASDMTGVEIKYSAKRAQAIFEMVSPAQGENLAAVFTDKMGANLINSLREATVTALREQAVAGGSMKDTAKAMRDKWFDAVKDGVPKFVDSSGKEWNTQTYFQMNVRTNSMRVYNDCLIDDVARETGSDVMRISTGGDPNCECAAWEGTLVSLTGKTKGLPTYDDAKAGGCFHPNCVHTLEYVDEYADADEIKRAQDHPYQDPGPDGDIWQVQDDRKYEIDQAVKMDEQGMTQEEARVAVDRDNLAASIRAGLIRSDADDLVAKMTDAQVTALCKDGNPPEFQPFKPTKKELADGAVQKWNHGKWGGVVHVDAGASAEDILKVCKIGDGEQNAPGANAKAPTNAPKAKDDKSTEPKTDATEGQENAPIDYSDLPKDEQSAIEWYVSGEGQFINQYLRGNVGEDFGKLSDTEQKMIDAMKRGTDHKLSDDINVLYRSVDINSVLPGMSESEYQNLVSGIVYGNKDRFAQPAVEKFSSIVGKQFMEKGFMSTTRDKDIAAEWGDFTGATKPMAMEIKVSSGTRGIDLAKLDVEGEEQREVLLKNGVKYKVVGVSHIGSVPLLKVEIVDD